MTVQLVVGTVLDDLRDVGQLVDSAHLPAEIFGVVTAVAKVGLEQQAEARFVLQVLQFRSTDKSTEE